MNDRLTQNASIFGRPGPMESLVGPAISGFNRLPGGET